MSNAKQNIVLIVLALGLFSRVHAGTVRHDVDPGLYEQVGALSFFDSVGKINFTDVNGGNFVCSGTLIAPDWAVTAGHCAATATSLDFTVGGTTYAADAWGAHRDWDPLNPFNLILGGDIAVVHLSNPVTNVAPAQRYRGTQEVGHIGIFVGFGQTGTGLTGATTFDGVKRAGTNDIDLIGLNGRGIFADFDNPLNPGDSIIGSSAPLSLEIMVAPGDSGGAVFLVDNNELFLAGVNSFIFGLDFVPDADYGDLTGATRVSSFNDWIDPFVIATASASFDLFNGLATASVDLGSPFSDAVFSAIAAPATPTPEPSSFMIAVVLFGGLAMRRRSHPAG